MLFTVGGPFFLIPISFFFSFSFLIFISLSCLVFSFFCFLFPLSFYFTSFRVLYDKIWAEMFSKENKTNKHLTRLRSPPKDFIYIHLRFRMASCGSLECLPLFNTFSLFIGEIAQLSFSHLGSFDCTAYTHRESHLKETRPQGSRLSVHRE